MRNILLVMLIAFMAIIAVSGQSITQSNPNEDAAIMTPPAENLKKPLIFTPTVGPSAPDSDAPIIGTPPSNLVPSVVSDTIYTPSTEYGVGSTPNGCPCKQALPQKYRYDVRFRRDLPPPPPFPCPCMFQPQPKPEDSLPPIIARIRRDPPPPLVPCNTTQPIVPEPPKVVPEYYHPRYNRTAAQEYAAQVAAGTAPAIVPKPTVPYTTAEAAAAALPITPPAVPCANPNIPPPPSTIRPEFYLTQGERIARRRARHAARQAASQVEFHQAALREAEARQAHHEAVARAEQTKTAAYLV